MRQAHCDLKLFLCLLVILNVGHKTGQSCLFLYR